METINRMLTQEKLKELIESIKVHDPPPKMNMIVGKGFLQTIYETYGYEMLKTICEYYTVITGKEGAHYIKTLDTKPKSNETQEQ